MKRLFYLLTFFFTFGTISPALQSADPPSGNAFSLTTTEGKAIQPLDSGGKKGAVLFFVSPYCPTSNNFAPEMNTIQSEFDDSFAFRFVHSDTSVKPEDMVRHAELMEFKAPVLNDGEQKLAKLVRARITPEVVVIDVSGKVLYQGRINDLYLGPTKRQREVKTHDLRDALKAILEGREVATPRTEAFGCEIGGVE